MSLNNLGNVQKSLREYEAAKQSYTDALAIYRKALPRDHPTIADSLNNLGSVQYSLRAYEAAKQSHSDALAIKRKALPRDHPDIAMSLNNLGNVQHALREFEAARQSYTEALAINQKALPRDHPDIARSLNNLGLLELCSNGTSAATIESLGEALTIKRAEYVRLASLQAEAEQFATASDARSTLDLYLSATLDPGRDATPVFHQTASFKGAVTAHQHWTREVRNPKDAITAELLRKLTIVDRELLGSSLSVPSAGRSPESIDPRKRLTELQEQRKDLERQLTAHSEAYRVFLAKAKIGGGEIRAALPAGTCLIDFRDYKQVGPPPKGTDDPVFEDRLIAFVVKPGTAKMVLVPFGRSAPIATLVERWRASYSIGRMPAADEPDPAVALRKALWEPLQTHLGKDVRTVLISPDGPLHDLPFAALPGSKDDTFLLHEYAFAVVPVPVLLPEMLEKKPAPLGAGPLLLMGGIAFGDGPDPSLPTSTSKLPPVPRFNALEGTDSEVNDLRAQFEDAFPDAPPPTVLRKDRATKAAFLQNAPRYPYIHLATHGFFAQESEKSVLGPSPLERSLRDFQMDRVVVGRNPGLLSGVVFAGVNRPDRPKEDGVLTALEAGELDLGRTELVVLSACETGRGRVAGGEGVLGLQRAFQVAGARTTVASLWKVPDEETHQLMREFYRRLWDVKNPMPRAEALRQAQLWMLANRKRGAQPPEVKGPLAPHVWAAFVLAGDWR
ncbi:CHAT domain-containing protein [Fimbriiglobus ruber]|uniref:Kinesin light chain-like protein n=1 Tax=Fimbriiglobus ruber TaxID=1908690 RepID=A0A225DFR0_9BACT|nr:CHAT domain-containing tetratricopeptide repeat protein [Fimbriiglobus ruber]OWK40380.1 kinesin light chain-like protein [Fimbriiglobus ruber]